MDCPKLKVPKIVCRGGLVRVVDRGDFQRTSGQDGAEANHKGILMKMLGRGSARLVVRCIHKWVFGAALSWYSGGSLEVPGDLGGMGSLEEIFLGTYPGDP